MKGTTLSFHQRIGSKINLLQRVRVAGVWLLDAGIVGINGPDLAQASKARILQDCLDFTR